MSCLNYKIPFCMFDSNHLHLTLSIVSMSFFQCQDIECCYKCCFYRKECRQPIKVCQYVKALQAKSPLFFLIALFLPTIIYFIALHYLATLISKNFGRYYFRTFDTSENKNVQNVLRPKI